MAEIGSLAVSLSMDASKFNGTVSQVDRNLRAMGGELQAIKAKGTDFGNSVEGLGKKQEVLNRSLDAAGLKLQEQRKRYDELVASGKASDAQLERQAIAVNKAQTEYNRLETELKDVTEQLRIQSSQWTKAGQTLQDVGGKLKSIGSGMTDVGKKLSVAVTAPLMAMGAGIVKTGMDFEASMSKVAAISGATGSDLQRLTDQAKELGSSTSFSASQAAEGMEKLALAGWKTDSIIAAMPGMLDLAAAGALDLGRAADITSDVMSAFGLNADKARHAADVFAFAQANANTNVEMMGEAMTYLAPVANALGWELEESAAAVMKLSDSGVKGSMAGQAFATSLTRLAKPTKQMTKEMNALGMSFFDVDGNIRSMPELMKEVEKGTQGMTKEQKSATLSVLFGAEAYKHWAILLESGSDSLAKTTEELKNADGAASKMAKTMLDNTKGGWVSFTSAVEGLAIELSDAFLPAITKILEKGTEWVRKFTEMDKGTQNTILAIGGLVAAIGPVLVIGGTLISSIGTIVSAIGGMSVALGAASGFTAILGTTLVSMAGPIGIAVASIALIGGGLILLEKELSESSIQLQDWSEGVSEATAEAVGGFVKISDDVGQSLSQLHLTSATITDEMATDLTSKFDAMHSQIVEGANVKHEEQMESLRNFFANSSALTSDEEAKIFKKQQQSYEQELEILAAKNQIAADIIKKATEEKRDLTDHEREVLNNINLQMKEDAVRVLSQNEADQKVILEKMKADASELSALQAAEVVKNAVKQKEEVVAETEKTYDESIAQITRMRDETGAITAEQADRMIAEAKKSRDTTIKYAEEMHRDIVSEAKAQAGEQVNQVDWQTGEIKSKWEVMKTAVSSKMKQLGSDIKRDWTQIYNDSIKWVTNKVNKVEEGFSNMVSAVGQKMNDTKKAVSDGWNNTLTYFGEIPSKMVNIGKEIMNGLIGGISEMTDKVIESITGVVNGVINKAKSILKIQSPSKVFKEIGLWTGEGMAIGIDGSSKAVNQAMTNVSNGIIEVSKSYQKEHQALIRNHNNDLQKQEDDAQKKIQAIRDKAAKKKRSLTVSEQNEITSITTNFNNKKVKEEEAFQKKYQSMVEKSEKEYLAVVTQTIADKKSLNELSLIDEAEIWEQSIELFNIGSAERIKAQQEHNKALEAVRKEVDAVNTDYVNQITKINEDLAKQEETLTKAYEDAVDKRAQSLVSFKGLFDAFKAEIDVTGEELLVNLGSQVEGFKVWQAEVEKLSEKAIDKGLLEELRQMGPNALPQLIALNQLTDTQLRQYSDLYKEKSKLARTQAETELKGMKNDTDKQLKELRTAANTQLDTLQKEWNQKIKALTSTTSTELSSLKQIGRDAGQGLLDGLGSMEGALQRKAQSIADSISKTIQSALQIKSPSRVMRGFGVNIGEGLVLGMDDMVGRVSGAAQRLASSVEGNVANGNYSSSVNNSRSYSHGDTIIHVHGSNLSPSEIARKNAQAQRQLAMEWGMT